MSLPRRILALTAVAVCGSCESPIGDYCEHTGRCQSDAAALPGNAIPILSVTIRSPQGLGALDDYWFPIELADARLADSRLTPESVCIFRGDDRLDADLLAIDDRDGRLEAWILLPSYGDDQSVDVSVAACAESVEDSAASWSDFAAVWHLDEDRAEEELTRDSGPRALHGQASGLVDVPGIFGRALDFSGGGEVRVGNPGGSWAVDDSGLNLDLSSFSASAWVRHYPEPAGDSISILYKGGLTSRGYALMYTTGSGTLFFRTHDEMDTAYYGVESDTDLLDGEWHHVGLNLERTENQDTFFIFLDGDLAGSSNHSKHAGKSLSSDLDFLIGAGERDGQRWLGLVDEIRLTPGTRSEDWFRAEALTQNDPSQWIDVSP